MHSNARARHTVATKETERRVQQGSLCVTQVSSLHAAPAPPILLFNAAHSVAIQLHEPK